MSAARNLPQAYKTLVQKTYGSPLTVQTIPTPQPTPGSATVRILAAPILSYAKDVFNGTRPYSYPNPLIPGTSAIGRITAVGPDATSLKPGDFVGVDGFIRGRDEPTNCILPGLHEGPTPGSKSLMKEGWPYAGTFGEYAHVPLETCYRLDEKRLLGPPDEGGLGLSVEKLAFIPSLVVPFGGLKNIGLTPGERIIISPATGAFGGAAVIVALALGARVVALGRNAEKLKDLKAINSSRIDTVQISGDKAKDTAALKSFGPVDAFFDISPAMAAESTHIQSGILALSPGGRVSLMGGQIGDIAIPHSFVVHFNITFKGKFMYERADVDEVVRLVAGGLLPLDSDQTSKVVGQFALEDWEKAFDAAAANTGAGLLAVFKP